MPNLQHSLREFDYRHLQIVADLWGIPLDAPDARQALPQLVEAMKSPPLVEEILPALPRPTVEALSWLVQEGGRVTWALFNRRWGEIREMGPGRRDREKPHHHPVSPAEVLWYRAILARGFFDTDTGPQEFAYIPEDLLDIIKNCLFSETDYVEIPPAPKNQDYQKAGRPATLEERQHPILANDQILDHTCTLLAAKRMGNDPFTHLPLIKESAFTFFNNLLLTMGILDSEWEPNPEQTREFLSASRREALLSLWKTWHSSSHHNDLRLVPTLKMEGSWQNDILRTRKKVLDFLSHVPRDTWWSLSALVAWVKEKNPDFQRPSGDYDSWFLKDQKTEAYLRGFKHWEQVEGALLRYLISGPLHWLGILDIATPDETLESPVTAFRFSKLSQSLLSEEKPNLQQEKEPVYIRAKGELILSAYVPRKVRYQIARFCTWLSPKQEQYVYSLTPASLEQAEEQGLRVAHLMSLLQRHAEVVPPNLLKALRRWRQEGVEASMEKQTILRVHSPAMLEAIKKSNAARFLGERLGPIATIIEEGSEDKIAETLIEMGFLVGIKDKKVENQG